MDARLCHVWLDGYRSIANIDTKAQVGPPEDFDRFSFGPSDRGASIRIPIRTRSNGWKGYLEDGRPAADGDPYLITTRMVETIRAVHEEALKASG